MDYINVDVLRNITANANSVVKESALEVANQLLLMCKTTAENGGDCLVFTGNLNMFTLEELRNRGLKVTRLADHTVNETTYEFSWRKYE